MTDRARYVVSGIFTTNEKSAVWRPEPIETASVWGKDDHVESQRRIPDPTYVHRGPDALGLALLIAFVGACWFFVGFFAGRATAAESVPRNLPARSQTPGALNPVVTQATISATICVKGWTATIRPPSTYTSYLKRMQIQDRQLPGMSSDYEEDHLISLELGGSPWKASNLWPQSWPQARVDDRMENEWHAKVCSGELTLQQGRSAEIRWKRAHG